MNNTPTVIRTRQTPDRRSSSPCRSLINWSYPRWCILWSLTMSRSYSFHAPKHQHGDSDEHRAVLWPLLNVTIPVLDQLIRPTVMHTVVTHYVKKLRALLPRSKAPKRGYHDDENAYSDQHRVSLVAAARRLHAGEVLDHAHVHACCRYYYYAEDLWINRGF